MDTVSPREGTPLEVFWTFLKLGLTSFGGPIAHLGYFRAEVVTRRRWIDDRDYADLVALCQVLPGPASSQVGFGLGLRRAGALGALAAFVAFTLPSAALMLAFAYGAAALSGTIGTGLLLGLKVVAVAIVAQAVWGMARSLTPDLRRLLIAGASAALAILLAAWGGQLIAIAFGALGGWWLCRGATDSTPHTTPFRVSRRAGVVALILLALILLGVPAATVLLDPGRTSGLALFDTFARAGALVFGGGHVVLPLLHAGVVDPGWITEPQFLAGYGAAQAVPGPLFTFAAFLGALASTGPGGVLGAAIALVGIFTPGFLLLVGVLPFWNTLRRVPSVQAILRGVNAAVVGILAAALVTPVATSAITGPGTLILALGCLALLIVWKCPPWVVVAAGAAGGVALTALG